jgi:hypothetical protein
MELPAMTVTLLHIPDTLGGLSLKGEDPVLNEGDSVILARAGEILARVPQLQASVELPVAPGEPDSLAVHRFNAVASHLSRSWSIDSGRLHVARSSGTEETILRFRQSSEQ